jgi:hypothetical protein
MANVFDDILMRGIRSGKMPARNAESREWFRTQARQFGQVKPHTLIKSSPSKITQELMMGQMFLYAYDAKHKDTLPYYDQFPLVFPFESFKGGFIGMNLHYLPYKQRAMLMDALYNLTNNKKYDQSTKLRLSYEILSKAATSKWFQPTVHKYLYSQLRSRYLLIDSVEWDMAMMLPLHKFVGASATKVWSDSRKKMKK